MVTAYDDDPGRYHHGTPDENQNDSDDLANSNIDREN